MPGPEWLVDKNSDWLRLPFISVSGSFFRVQPCNFYNAALSSAQLNSVCFVMECSLRFDSDGQCKTAEISTGSVYIKGHEIRSSERCARTQVCLCRARANVHISRRLFAALLYLVLDTVFQRKQTISPAIGTGQKTIPSMIAFRQGSEAAPRPLFNATAIRLWNILYPCSTTTPRG